MKKHDKKSEAYQSTYRQLIRDNEQAANLVIAKLQLLIAAAYILVGFLILCGAFYGSIRIICTLFLFGAVFLLLSIYALQKSGTKSMPWLKYACVFLLLISVFLINILVGYRAWLLYAVPILLSVRFYNRRFTTAVGLFAILLTVCSAFTNAYLAPYTGVMDLNLVSFSAPGTLNYGSWLYAAVLDHGYDRAEVVVNGLQLSVLPNCLTIALVIMAANSVISNAVKLLMKESENYEHEIQLLRNAMTDGMTGLLNRRAFNEDVAALTKASLPKDLAYISLDLDGLKVANDTLGHVAGDEIIIAAAQCIRDTFEPYGKVYRMGGDEFAAIVNADDELLTRLKGQFEAAVAGWSGEIVKSLSVSAGYIFASELPDFETIDDVAKQADQRMYESKRKYYAGTAHDRRRR